MIQRRVFGVIALFSLGVNAQASSFFPSTGQWKAAVIDAAKSPATWVPLTGAAVILATNTDKHISDWASEKHPVFGSGNHSNNLKDISEVAAYSSLLFSPQQNAEEDGWVEEKGIRLAEQYAAVSLSDSATGALKNIVRRQRPDDPAGKHSYSFPSGHATEAFAYAAVTGRNLQDYDISEGVRAALNVGVYTIASGVAWARVEEQGHYPSDVLFGAALGNFVASTVYNAFADTSREHPMSVGVMPVDQGMVLNVQWRY